MNRAQLTDWFRARLAERTGVPAERIDLERPLESIGLDSMEAVELTSELETQLGRTVEPTALWDHPTASALISHLADPTGTAELSDAEVHAQLERLLDEGDA